MASNGRRTREEIRRLVWDFLKSRQSISEFAEANAVRPEHLKRWIRREEMDGPQVDLVQVKVRPPAANRETSQDGQIEVVLAGGRLVRAPMDVDPETLARLIEALERPC